MLVFVSIVAYSCIILLRFAFAFGRNDLLILLLGATAANAYRQAFAVRYAANISNIVIVYFYILASVAKTNYAQFVTRLSTQFSLTLSNSTMCIFVTFCNCIYVYMYINCIIYIHIYVDGIYYHVGCALHVPGPPSHGAMVWPTCVLVVLVVNMLVQLYITNYYNIALAQRPIRTYFRESLSHTILAIAGHCLLSSAAVEYSEQTSCQEGLRQPNSCP